MPTTIGLDIGSSAVRAVQVRTGGREPAVLERLGQVMLPPGAVRDGEIVEADAVVEALRKLWSDFKLRSRKVALGVANQHVVVRQVELPYLPEKELRQSLQFQASDHIPIPVDQAVLDFHVLGTYETADGERSARILLVAAQRHMVETLVDVVRRAKLEPVGIDLDAFALLRSLAPEEVLGEGGCDVVVDIGGAVTNVVVHERGEPRFVRTVLMGGGGITDSLVSVLGMPREQAEREKAISGVMDTSGLRRAEDEPIHLIAQHAERFVEELRGSLDYYGAQDDALPLRRVVLTGGGAQLPNLRDQLASGLAVPVEHGHPMQELQIGKTGLATPQLVEAEPYLAVAIGLALGAAA